MTSVSIAMAAFNGERFLREQLDSFAAQSRLPDELVISDDCSTDGTLAIAEAFAASAPFPVRIERNPENVGYSQNFGRAMSLCSGDVMFLSDQDDIWYPDKIATVLAAIHAAGRPVVTVNDQQIADANGRSLGTTIFENARRLGMADRELIAGSCTAMPRSLFSLVLPIPAEAPYDSWIGLIANSLDMKCLIERPLQLFRRHGSNASQPLAASPGSGRWSDFLGHGFSDPRDSWSLQCDWRSTFLERLTAHHAEFAELLGSQALRRAISSNERHIAALRGRSAIISERPAKRLPKIAQSWRSGLYAEFGGWKSAVKDAVRPTYRRVT